MKNVMAKGDSGMCCGGMCHKCRAWKVLILGIIFLANTYWPFMDSWELIGWLLVIGGVIKMIMPSCGHCK